MSIFLRPLNQAVNYEIAIGNNFIFTSVSMHKSRVIKTTVPETKHFYY
jgi:hypothetical protein